MGFFRSPVLPFAIVCLSCFVGAEAFGQTTGYGSAELLQEAKNIQAFLFGPAMRLAGVVGGAYGLVQATLTSTLRPLITYGGIGLAVNLVPKFIDGVYGVSSMLLP